ncbi:DUF3717 domain-containing protein [Herbaspirillum lusitanum]|jgi:hypothetical protein|uniref:DUF3717 domain-containing protein n=1 Tax=Herbaspirillum lusitanum TaxID=213312 RepID=A0ABW9AFH9_9BURK
MDEPSISLTDLEQAINYWRLQRPATGEECALSPEVNALADLYALMIYHRAHEVPAAQMETQARQLFDSWKSTRG